MSTMFAKASHTLAPRHAQRGLTMTTALAIMCVAVFIATFAFKAAPAYFENWTVVKVVDSVMQDSQVANGPRKAIYKQLNAQFGHNNLWHVKAEDVVELKRGDTNTYVATVAYEKRETLFSNIDLVMSFNSGADEP